MNLRTRTQKRTDMSTIQIQTVVNAYVMSTLPNFHHNKRITYSLTWVVGDDLHDAVPHGLRHEVASG